MKSLKLILDSSFLYLKQTLTIIPPRTSKDVILISQCLKQVAKNLENVIPIKAYDGRKSKNCTLMNLGFYLMSNIYGQHDSREVIKRDFLSICPYYVDNSEDI